MRNFLLFYIVGCTVLTAGCGGGGRSETPTYGPTRTVTETGESDALRYTLTMKNSYTRSERVTAEFAIENTGDTAINYSYGGYSPIHGTVSQRGEEVDYYAEEGCTADLKTRQLLPGQRSVFPLTLRGNNAAGTNEPGQYKLTSKMYINQKVYGPDPIPFALRADD